MPCDTEWPIAEPCGTYGRCVDPAAVSVSLSAGDVVVDPHSATAYCECQAWWIGDGDYVSHPGSYCVTHTAAVRALWSVTTLVACYTVYKSWSTVIGFALRQRAHAQLTALAQQAVLSHNGTQGGGGTLNTIGTGGGHLGMMGAGMMGSSDDRCGLCVSVAGKMWGSAPIRLALLMCVSSAALLSLGVLKLVRLDMTGFQLGATCASATALLFVWASVYTAMVSLVQLQINIIKMHFSVTDKNRVRKQLQVFRHALVGVFCVLPTTGSFLQFVIYAQPQHMDVLATVYCLSQVGNAFCTGVALWYVANNLIAILSGQATGGTPSGTGTGTASAKSNASGTTTVMIKATANANANAKSGGAAANGGTAAGPGNATVAVVTVAIKDKAAAPAPAPATGLNHSTNHTTHNGGTLTASHSNTLLVRGSTGTTATPLFASGRVAPAPPSPLTASVLPLPAAGAGTGEASLLPPPPGSAGPAAAAAAAAAVTSPAAGAAGNAAAPNGNANGTGAGLLLSPKSGSRPPSPRAISAAAPGGAGGGGGGGGVPAKTTTAGVSAERVEFATRMRDLKTQGVGIMRNQIVIYLAFGLFPLLRSCLTYQAPFSWTMAMAGQLFTLAALGDRRKPATAADAAGGAAGAAAGGTTGAAARQALNKQLAGRSGGVSTLRNTQLRNGGALGSVVSPKHGAESRLGSAVGGSNGKYLVRVQPKPAASPRALSDDGGGGAGGPLTGAVSGAVSGAASPRSPASPLIASPPPAHRAPTFSRPLSGARDGALDLGLGGPTGSSAGAVAGVELVPTLSMPPPMMVLGSGAAVPPPLLPLQSSSPPLGSSNHSSILRMPPLGRGSSGATNLSSLTIATTATTTTTTVGATHPHHHSSVTLGTAATAGGAGASPALDSLLTIAEQRGGGGGGDGRAASLSSAAFAMPPTSVNATAAAAAAAVAPAAARKESTGDVKIADIASEQ